MACLSLPVPTCAFLSPPCPYLSQLLHLPVVLDEAESDLAHVGVRIEHRIDEKRDRLPNRCDSELGRQWAGAAWEEASTLGRRGLGWGTGSGRHPPLVARVSSEEGSEFTAAFTAGAADGCRWAAAGVG